MSLSEYLLKNWEKNHIDHSLRVERHSEEGIHCYIHPAAVDGDTLDFIISPDDQVRQVPAADSEAPTQGLE
ncbi:hypothetical protein PN499_26640 [Kamptonema animale CS-326]|jgi:hypothetical protein|nr:hypothetical protein [Kamptonema animale CS-326]